MQIAPREAPESAQSRRKRKLGSGPQLEHDRLTGLPDLLDARGELSRDDGDAPGKILRHALGIVFEKGT